MTAAVVQAYYSIIRSESCREFDATTGSTDMPTFGKCKSLGLGKPRSIGAEGL
jgi:hypothetical protein